MAKGRKTGGRLPGTQNKLTSQFKDKIGRLIDYYMGDDVTNGAMWEDMQQMSPVERTSFIKGLMNYVVAKQVEEQVNLNTGDKKFEDILLESIDE